ncbi:MAG: radical SAM/SPASM domain-containing protein [Bdellovibrio sp.]
MSYHQFKYAIDQAAPLAKQICLHLMGEPLAHKELEKFLMYAEEKNVQINLTTNGLLLPQKKEILLNSMSLYQLNVSVQSFHDNFPEKSLEDYLEKVMNVFDEIMKLRSEVYLNLRLWNLGTDDNENEEVLSYLENRYSIQINRNTDSRLRKSKKLFNRLYLHFDTRFKWPSFENDNFGRKGTCQGLRNHIGVLSDGTVVPCCLDKEAKINLGNLFEKNLESIINSDRAQKIKKGFENGVLVEKFCQHCPYIKRFDKKLERLNA